MATDYITTKDIPIKDEGEQFFALLLVAGVTKGKGTNGKDYLDVDLMDSHGSVSGKVWDCKPIHDQKIVSGNVLLVDATKNTWQGKIQVKILSINLMKNEVPKNYIPSYPKKEYEQAKKDFFRQYDLVAKLDPSLKGPLDHLFTKEKFDRFCICPAAVRHHGAKLHGLIIHVSSVGNNVLGMLSKYTPSKSDLNGEITDELIAEINESIVSKGIDLSLLMFVVLTHDINKMVEYDFGTDKPFKYTDSYALSHEASIGIEYGRAFPEDFPRERLEKALTLVLAHHGKWAKWVKGSRDKEFPEEMILHAADVSDARIRTVLEGFGDQA